MRRHSKDVLAGGVGPHQFGNYLGFSEGLSEQFRQQAASHLIAVGQRATAAQAIDHDLLDESLRSHSLPRIGNGGGRER